MKKLTVILIAMGAGIFFFIEGFSQLNPSMQDKTSSQSTQIQKISSYGYFVDKNNNGVCDNLETRAKVGKGRFFVDKNGDGVCDNFNSQGQMNGNGNCLWKGNGYRHGNYGWGHGRCAKGNGQGFQHRHGWSGMHQTSPANTQDEQNKK